jgi:hypothetical protein
MAGVEITLEMPDIVGLLSRLDFAPYDMEQQAQSAMDDSVGLLADAIRDLTPSETGYLRGSITEEVAPGAREMEGRVFTTVSYGPPVEEGHGVIVPHKEGGRLRLDLPGGTIFRWRTKAREGVHMFRRGGEAARGKIIDRFQFALEAVAEHISGK